MRNIFKWYHERTAIEVTLSAWTGWTATYTNLPWESYVLASLPVWAEIVLDNWDYLIYYDGFPRWEIEVAPSSDYKLDSMVISRWWTQISISSTPITLQDWDEINATFIMTQLCFTANTAWSTIKLNKKWSPTSVTLETSTDWITWSTYTFWDTITLTNVWDKVYWRNTSETDTWFSTASSIEQYYPLKYYNVYQFVMTWSIAWSWDTNYLLNKNSTTTVSTKCYTDLFYECKALTTAPALPATTLANNCYQYMFYWCTWLTTAPVTLPATTLATQCYLDMFNWCTKLIAAPSLPATTLASQCYSRMFNWCTNLTTAPTTLPATILSGSCYEDMFQNCSKLAAAPALPATTLAQNCYYAMFNWCESLTTVPSLPATTLVKNCYYAMFTRCTNLTAIPELSATTLAEGCYGSMFSGCSKIKLSETQTWEYVNAYRIPTTWTWTDASDSMASMFGSTWWTFTGTPTIDTTYYTSNTIVPAT